MIPVTEALYEAGDKKDELLEQLVSFVLTDSLLFVAPEEKVLKACKEKVFAAVDEANALLGTGFLVSFGLDIPPQNYKNQKLLAAYLRKLSKRTFAVAYLAAVELRSVLGGILFAQGKVDAEQIFSLAFYEELFEQGTWGRDEVVCYRQDDIKSRLKKLEHFRDEGSLS